MEWVCRLVSIVPEDFLVDRDDLRHAVVMKPLYQAEVTPVSKGLHRELAFGLGFHTGDLGGWQAGTFDEIPLGRAALPAHAGEQ